MTCLEALKDAGDSPQDSRYVSSIFMWLEIVFIIWHYKYGERSVSPDNKDLDITSKKCN